MRNLQLNDLVVLHEDHTLHGNLTIPTGTIGKLTLISEDWCCIKLLNPLETGWEEYPRIEKLRDIPIYKIAKLPNINAS